MKKSFVKLLRKAIKNNKTYKFRWIYLLDRNTLAKGISENSSKTEFEIGSYLYSKGLQVPRFHQLIECDDFSKVWRKDFISTFYVIMEKLQGTNLLELKNKNLENKIIPQYFSEIKKVLELGFIPVDSNAARNILFNKKDQKIYLIGFERWYKGTTSDIGNFYNKIFRCNFKFNY